MTFAKSIELQFLAGHRFHVKLTPMSIAKPLRQIWLFNSFTFGIFCQCVSPSLAHLHTELVLEKKVKLVVSASALKRLLQTFNFIQGT